MWQHGLTHDGIVSAFEACVVLDLPVTYLCGMLMKPPGLLSILLTLHSLRKASFQSCVTVTGHQTETLVKSAHLSIQRSKLSGCGMILFSLKGLVLNAMNVSTMPQSCAQNVKSKGSPYSRKDKRLQTQQLFGQQGMEFKFRSQSQRFEGQEISKSDLPNIA